MAKIKSSLPNMIMSLTFISLGMAAALGYVYISTKGPIEQANQKKVVDAIAKVVPAFDNDPVKEIIKVSDGTDTIYMYPAKKGGELVGMAVKSYTLKGFSGYISIMAGFLPDGSINSIEVLDQKETPGLGTLMMEPKFKDQFKAKNPADFKLMVKKDGGQVDAITAATISSRAFCDALTRAYETFMSNQNGGSVPDSAAVTDTLTLAHIEPVQDVLPAFDNDPLQEKSEVDGCELFAGRKNGKLTGVAVKSFAKGYNGNIWVLTGFVADGTINKITVLRQTESKGKGTQACEEEFLSQFIGKKAAELKSYLKEEGGDIDGISSCTISANAVCKAIDMACKAFQKGGVK